MISQWPQMDDTPLCTDDAAVEQYGALQSLVRAVRNARAEYQVEPGKKIAANIVVTDDALRAAFEGEAAVIALLGRVEESGLTFSKTGGSGLEGAEAAHLIVADGLEAYLPLADLVDPVKETKRLTKQFDKLEKDVSARVGVGGWGWGWG